MAKKILIIALVSLILCSLDLFAVEPKLKKVSDHCYYLPLENGAWNVFVVITEEGVLMVNPPQEADRSNVINALNNATSKPVRWLAFTDYRFPQTSGARFFSERGALFMASSALRSLAETLIPEDAPENPAPPEPDGQNHAIANTASSYSAPSGTDKQDGVSLNTPSVAAIRQAGERVGDSAAEVSPFPWLIFETQMYLFPSNLEIRIMALRHKARTGGDVVVYVPEEKVLFVGGLYEAARYPEIDAASGGDAVEWMDGIKQVLDSVPVLKPAIPKEETASEEDNATLEEGITVVSAKGEASNLQNMKDLLEGCQKLKRDVSRSVRIGRSCSSFLASSSANGYYSYGNLSSYAAQLFAALDSPGDGPH